MIDKFSQTSLTLKGHKESVSMNVRGVERTYQDFVRSNAKLATLLDASRIKNDFIILLPNGCTKNECPAAAVIAPMTVT